MGKNPGFADSGFVKTCDELVIDLFMGRQGISGSQKK